jgi:hypothetical protein
MQSRGACWRRRRGARRYHRAGAGASVLGDGWTGFGAGVTAGVAGSGSTFKAGGVAGGGAAGFGGTIGAGAGGRKVEVVRVEGSYAVCMCGSRQVRARLDYIFSDGKRRRSGYSTVPEVGLSSSNGAQT